MALIPKVKVSGRPASILAVITALVGLAIIPIIAAAAMVVVGISWKEGERWARVTLIIGAVLYVAFAIVDKHPAVHHG